MEVQLLMILINRVHEMMLILTSTQNRDNDDVEGFGERWDALLSYPTGGANATGFPLNFVQDCHRVRVQQRLLNHY